MVSPLHFFAAVLRPSFAAIALAAATLAFALYLGWIYPGGFDQVLGIALFLQLFGASTGYRERLGQGHFDPALAGRSGRLPVAVAHWSVSVGLGGIVWAALGIVDLASNGRWPNAFSPAALIVFAYVSTVAWTLSLLLGRYGGAIAWLLLLFAMASIGRLQALRAAFSTAPDSLDAFISSAAGALTCPIFLLISPFADSASLLAIVVVVAAAAWMFGALLIGRFDGVLAEI
jgi:hypothetical protein